MYHISNDQRAKRSASRIGNGLLTCLQSKSLADITVTDVQRASSVGRATFYRLFDNITDILSYLCDSVFEEAGYKFDLMNAREPKQTSLIFIQTWINNKTLLKAIVDCGRIDILYASHSKYLGCNMNFFFPDMPMSKEQQTYLMTSMTACTSACLIAWLKNGSCETAEQVQTRLCGCFNILASVFG